MLHGGTQVEAIVKDSDWNMPGKNAGATVCGETGPPIMGVIDLISIQLLGILLEVSRDWVLMASGKLMFSQGIDKAGPQYIGFI